MKSDTVKILASATLATLADFVDGPEDITEVLAEMCKLHEEILGDVDECQKK